MMTSRMENITIKGDLARDYFKNEDDIIINDETVVIELYHTKRAATYTIVPQGAHFSNLVPEDDDYDGVIFWLYEHGFKSPGIDEARRGQVGL